MRLDHLLSREPSFVGNERSLTLLGWWVFCFLVLAFVHHCLWVVGVGAFWVGHKGLWRADTLSGSRSTLCWRPPLLWWLPAWPASSVVLLVWVVCGGLFVICIVVASIFVLYCFLCFV